jgi:RNA polymerase sigma-70 factor (ECF subfamily)
LSEFTKIMDDYGALLSRVASTYEANESLQQELFQEICMAVWQSLKNYKGDASIKTYILRVAHNRCVTHVGKQVKNLKTATWDEQDKDATLDESLQQTSQGTEQKALQEQQIERLLHLIRQLKLPARQIISLSLEGLSYQEIADVTGLSVTNVGVSIKRIKTDLQRQMQDDA